MAQYNVLTNQNHISYIPFYDFGKPPEFIADKSIHLKLPMLKANLSSDYIEQLDLLLIRQYSIVDFIVNKSQTAKPIIVQPPPKKVLASIELRLSSKGYKKRLPTPII
jgi:hypothetical protein